MVKSMVYVSFFFFLKNASIACTLFLTLQRLRKNVQSHPIYDKHAKTREQQNYYIPLSKNKKFLLEKNEPIIPQKTVNQEEFKNPKTVSQKESKKEIMLNKNKENPSKPTPIKRKKIIKQN